MHFCLPSKRLSRLCFREFQLAKELRKMLHVSALIFTNKKFGNFTLYRTLVITKYIRH